MSSGQLLKTLQGHLRPVNSVAFSPDGNLLASGSGDRTILWEISNGKVLCIMQGQTENVYSVAFSPDGSLLAGGKMRLWETSSGKLLNTLQADLGTVWSVAFSPSGKLLASGGFDQTVRLWETSSGKLLHTLRSDRPYERMNGAFNQKVTHPRMECARTHVQKTRVIILLNIPDAFHP